MKTNFFLKIIILVIIFNYNISVVYSNNSMQSYKEAKERILDKYNENINSIKNYYNIYCEDNSYKDKSDCDLIENLSKGTPQTNKVFNIDSIEYVDDIPKYINYFNNETYDLVYKKFVQEINIFLDNFIIQYKLKKYNKEKESKEKFHKNLYYNLSKIHEYIKRNFKYNIKISLRTENIGQILFNNIPGSYELFEIHDLVKRKIGKCSGYSKFVALILYKLGYNTDILLMNLIDGAHEVVIIKNQNEYLISDPTNYQTYNTKNEKNLYILSTYKKYIEYYNRNNKIIETYIISLFDIFEHFRKFNILYNNEKLYEYKNHISHQYENCAFNHEKNEYYILFQRMYKFNKPLTTF